MSEKGLNPEDGVLVIVFQAVPAATAKTKGTSNPTSVNEATEEYERLVKALKSVGLYVSTAAGEPSSGTILLFVRPSQNALSAVAAVERVNDYLHGVRSSSEAPVSLTRTSSLPHQPLASLPTMTSADRLRYAYALVTSAPCKDQTLAYHTVSGAGVDIRGKDFPRVVDILPLHDDDFNKQWLKKWTAPSSMFTLGVKDLDAVRDHFGEQVAFYFGFLIFYFNALLPMALLGLIFYAAGRPYDAAYSLGLVGWACLFVESWKLRERKLAVRWGCFGVSASENRRKEFTPQKVATDPVTGEKKEVFQWWRRELRMAVALPIMVFFAGLLGAVMTSVFIIEVFVTKLYTGPGKAVVPFAPTALFTTAVPQILALWQSTAAKLTHFENHRTRHSHQRALTLKMFALQAFVAYGALTLSAFVYIPFGQQIMDAIVDGGFFAKSISNAVAIGQLSFDDNKRIRFDVNPNRMHTQLFAVSVTSQIINAFTELILPIILRKVAEHRSKGSAKSNAAGSSSISRVLQQLTLPVYDTFADYAEMVTQFGYITLWSTIWPLSPVMGFVNNFFEIRSDAAKICINARRPIPERVESVGPWLDALGFIAWLAAMINAALLYLYQSTPVDARHAQPADSTLLRQHGHHANDTGSPAFSLSDVLPVDSGSSPHASALLVAFLVATASEHGYGIFRSFVRHVLERAMWKSSSEAEDLGRREWQSRRTLLHLHEKKTPRRDDVAEESISSFWTQNDHGRELIMNYAKLE